MKQGTPGGARSCPRDRRGAELPVGGSGGDALAAALNGLPASGFEVALSDRNDTEGCPDEPVVWRRAFSRRGR